MSREPDLIRAVTTDGVFDLPVDELSPGERSALAGHDGAIERYLGGDDRALVPFRGVTVAGHVVETDPNVIDALEREGDLDGDVYPSRGTAA